MSVRRLANEAVQPREFAFTAENESWARAKMAEYPAGHQQSAVIPILMRAQEQEGWVSRPAVEYVARMLDMAYIRVLEVATFYTQFQLHPVGRNAHIQVCGTTPCMLRGAEDLMAACRRHIHDEPGHTNAEGTLSWEEVECLGACVNAPMVMIGQDTYEDLTVERFEEIIAAFAAGKGDTIPPGTQIDRQFSAPIGGDTTLLEPAGRTRDPFAPPPPPETPASAPPAAADPKPSAETPAAEKKSAKAGADDQEPTKPARKRPVTEEGAPAMIEPKGAPKVSEARAEADRAASNAEAASNGRPNRAMREDATGSESPAGKTDAGNAPGKTPGRVASEAITPLFKRPEGAPDDLKLISGVGPKLEAELHALGITTYAQVAALSPEDVRRIDDALSFRGRVARDNWIGQAEALARGGAAEYERVFGKKPR